MEAIRIQDGLFTVDYMPTTDIGAGKVVQLGDLLGITTAPIKANTLGALNVRGVFDVLKVNGQAISIGALVYWDNTAKRATTTATNNKLLGKAVAAAAAADQYVRVLVNQ